MTSPSDADLAGAGRPGAGAPGAGHPGTGEPDAALEAARRRANRVIVGGSALGSIGYIAALTVAVIVAREMLHDATFAGAATTATIVGSAAGTSLLSWLMVRRGRRAGLSLGLAISVSGGLVATLAVVVGAFPLLLLGLLLFGFGNSSLQLSRYTAADLATANRRAWAIGLVVWASTVGAIVGPNIVPLAAGAAAAVGVAELAGPFLLATVVMAGTGSLWFALLRPDPYELAQASSRPDPAGDPVLSMRQVLRRPAVAMAVLAMVVGQVVMVGIMTMTPLHMTDHGHGLAAVGLVISAHTAGMFALSPVSGRIAQRLGDVAGILIGAAVLGLAALLAIAAPPDGGVILTASLFLLGYGWNLGFVSGSALLVSAVEHTERTRTEGFADTLVWGSSAVASLASGFILAAAGFAALAIVSMVLLVGAVAAMLRLRGRVGAVVRAV
jgi:MFS family permease